MLISTSMYYIIVLYVMNTLSKEKRVLARIFGIHGHILDLERKIRELSWDSAFNMWTRNAFLQFCSVMPRGVRTVAFIDLDDIHGLNASVGYREVDRRIRDTFSIPWRSSDIVARWYSGDEIVILFDNDIQSATDKMFELKKSGKSHDIGFVHELGSWVVGEETIECVVDNLTKRLKRNNPWVGQRA